MDELFHEDLGRCILGVDPGVSGAVAFYYPEHPDRVVTEDVPVAAGEINVPTLRDLILEMKPGFAWVERVHSMPKQGVSSSFAFGMAFGTVRGVIQALGVPMELVTPQRWKKAYRLDSDKEKARALALRLWPMSKQFSRKKDHGRAEAALIAKFGAGQAAEAAASKNTDVGF